MWLCAQLGAREHYAIPRSLHKAGQLGAVYTDFWAGASLRHLAATVGTRTLRSMATRFHPALAQVPVAAWNLRSLEWEIILRRGAQKGDAGRYASFIKVGRRFACAVREHVRRRADLSEATCFFSYDTGALEVLEFLSERGVCCVLGQMDTNRVEVNLVREEEKRWPGWQQYPTEVPEEYFRRREQEWLLADRVVVNSDFSRRALIQQGVPPEKLVVVPLCYEETKNNKEHEAFSSKSIPDVGRPLRVLWLGQVILRKGIQYLLQAARLLEQEYIRFDVVGPIGISGDAVASAPRNVVFHGPVSRDQVGPWYLRSDVFVLPTLSDGFAITQLEAMAHGLPVITTLNCGQVVTDGIDGFIVPAGDAASLAAALQRYLLETTLLRDHNAAALRKAQQFTLDHVAEKLLKLEAN